VSPHGFAIDAADVYEWPAKLWELSDRCRIIYWSTCLSLHASNHALNIFRGAGLDHEDKYRTYIPISFRAVLGL
jgi:hypothetical protein